MIGELFQLSQTGEAILTLTVVVVMFLLFLRETFTTEVTAMLGVTLLLATGVLSYEDGLSVLSNPAPWTIAAMFVVMGALVRTGSLDALTQWAEANAKTRPTFTLWTGLIFVMGASLSFC